MKTTETTKIGRLCTLLLLAGALFPVTSAHAASCNWLWRLFGLGHTPAVASQATPATSSPASADNPATAPRTSWYRDYTINMKVAEMERTVHDGHTPWMEIFPEDDSYTEMLNPNANPDGGYENPYDYKVTGIRSATPRLRATILLPVSGHTGWANAEKWAKTDTYDLYVESPSLGRVYLARNAKSQGVISRQNIDIPLKEGEKVTLYYSRSGSGGPDGFPGGRVMGFEWNGN